MRQIQQDRQNTRGSSLLLVVMLIATVLVLTIGFLKRSSIISQLVTMSFDRMDANYQMEAALETSKHSFDQAIDSIELTGKLGYFNTTTPGWSSEDFTSISQAYGQNTAGGLRFLKDLVVSEALRADNTLDPNHPYRNFDQAFPTTWFAPSISNAPGTQARYSFRSLTPSIRINATNQIFNTINFDYEYRIEARALGRKEASEIRAEESGLLTIRLAGAPFSEWAVFRDQTASQTGADLYFAGGQIEEVFNGKVHTNSRPNFLGHPRFKGLFTSSRPESDWNYRTDSGYGGSPYFDGGKNVVASVAMPSVIFNTARLAAGDTNPNAAINTDEPSTAELVGFLRNHALGQISGNPTSVSAGVYIPTDSSPSHFPTGGIYVQGDARIAMDVVRDQAAFSNPYQYQHLNPSDQHCKFQKIQIDSLTSGVPTRDIYIGEGACNVTYIFNADDSASSPTVLPSRLNGNLHVNGSIDQLGGASRTRPAVAQDFGLTISATKDVRIYNDLQYEDAEYLQLDNQNQPTGEPVATPSGELNHSGYNPTSPNMAARISEDSKTLLGIISIKRNVIIHNDAPANLNLHASVYAGNASAYDSSTGYGCGTTSAGCGFGYEGYENVTGKGNLKLLGSVSEYRSQTVGRALREPTGYARRYFYDTRLLQKLSPPGFPVSSRVQVYILKRPFKSFRMAQSP